MEPLLEKHKVNPKYLSYLSGSAGKWARAGEEEALYFMAMSWK